MTAYWTKLAHNGAALPEPYRPDGLFIRIRGRDVKLSPAAEEMAYHLAKKKETPYIQDSVFVANFMQDFVKQLPDWCGGAKFDEVDFSAVYRKVDGEKTKKETMSKEQRKALAADRKASREALKAKFGFAQLDGKRVEIANWLVEPPGLFMGRGCVASDTIVKTVHEAKYVQELVPGDLIATHHGSDNMFYRAVASVAMQGVRRTFLLRTRTHSIRATDNHPFLTLKVKRIRRRDGNGRFSAGRYPSALVWVPLSELKKGDYVVTVKRYQTLGTSKYSNTPRRTFNNMVITPKFARLLGYYLGDGFMKKRESGVNSVISFSEGNPVLLERYGKICEDVFGVIPVARKHSGGNSMVLQVFSHELADVVESMGVVGNALTKRVPGWVYDMADDLKCAFLRGYLDADGNFFANKIRDVEYGSFAFESTNRRLIEDLRELAISAGLQVSNISHRDNHGYAGTRAYRFFINEYLSVSRLFDRRESLGGERTRYYSLSSRSNELRAKWDWSDLHILDSELFALERILEMKDAGKSMTYDVSMADFRSPNFVANGFVVHNSHPLRGRWKPRVTRKDVILNLDRQSAVPPGEWKKVVHDHNSMWVAKWIDKLTGKEKYVWLHESAPLQQSRNKEKYDSATKVGTRMEKIRSRIIKGLSSKDPKVRQIATVCYLIDQLGLRVGDEKDEDEADTVGATTLRVEHVKVNGKSLELDFIGKDSVAWSKTIEPTPAVLRNIQEFTSSKKPGQLIFDDISSNMVNSFLSKIVPALTAKVFRTHHATYAAEAYLRMNDSRQKSELEKLYEAKMANLEAAKFCNHQRTIPKNWEGSLQRKKEKLSELQRREKKDEKRIHKLTMNIELQEKTKNYNLNTSLKNYVDPRLYKSWCDYVGLDWTKIYTASMQRKFAWVIRARTKWESGEKDTVEVFARSG